MKNILLICPKYFGYENYIKSVLEKKGYKVFIIFENICEYSIFFKIFTKYISFTRNIAINLYYKLKLRIFPKKYDFLFVIRGSTISKEILLVLDKKIISEKIMYQWDSVENNRNSLDIKDYFDSISTFDYQDSLKYNWRYIPLFYIDALRNSAINNKDIDILFLGSMHSERMAILKEIEKITNKKMYAKLYTPKQSYLKNLLLRTGLYDSKNVTTKAISLKNVYNLYSHARVVIDYTHPKQNGITIRSIEAIGNDCKLITNNQNIKNEHFYNSEDIYVYHTPKEIPEILSKINYQLPTNYKSKESYEINKWLELVLNTKN